MAHLDSPRQQQPVLVAFEVSKTWLQGCVHGNAALQASGPARLQSCTHWSCHSWSSGPCLTRTELLYDPHRSGADFFADLKAFLPKPRHPVQTPNLTCTELTTSKVKR